MYESDKALKVLRVYHEALNDVDVAVQNAIYEVEYSIGANEFANGWTACVMWFYDNAPEEFRKWVSVNAEKNISGKWDEIAKRFPTVKVVE